MQSMEDRIKYVMGDLLLSNVRNAQQAEENAAEVERLKQELAEAKDESDADQ